MRLFAARQTILGIDIRVFAMIGLCQKLRATLRVVGEMLTDASDPWWIITSAAAALHGVHPINVGDVDVLLSIGDAQRLRHRRDVFVPKRKAHPLFRSETFLTASSAPLAIEFMAGFHVSREGEWILVKFDSRESRLVDDHIFFIPSRPELIELSRRMGRVKDLNRARQLELLKPYPTSSPQRN